MYHRPLPFTHAIAQNMTLLEMLHVAAEERVGALSLDGIEEEEEEEGEGDGGDEPFLSTTLERQGRDPATAAAGAPAKPKAKLVVGRDGSVLKL